MISDPDLERALKESAIGHIGSDVLTALDVF
jgi:hypothetical protein